MVFDANLFTSMPMQKKLSVTLMFECMTFKIQKKCLSDHMLSRNDLNL